MGVSGDGNEYGPQRTAEFLPARQSIAALRRAAEACAGCELHELDNRTVFSSGPARARLAMVGEEPGDVEDRRGEPFVGPAGRLLRRAMAELDLDVGHTYLTNAVKHFSYRVEAGSAWRLHKTPTARQVRACRPWLVAELRRVSPAVLVLLGATAVQSVLGDQVKVSEQRGRTFDAADAVGFELPPECRLLVTVHPSSVLRSDDREMAYRAFLDDLRGVAPLMG